MKYYCDKEIAKLLGISLNGLRHKLVVGDPLPPRIRPPNCRNRLWPKDAVHAWLKRFQEQSCITRSTRSERGSKSSNDSATAWNS